MAWEDRYTPEQLADVAYAALRDEANAAIAVAVAMAESGGRMTVNRDAAETPESLRGVDRCASYGPWQINYCPTRDRGTIRERAANEPTLPVHVLAMKQVHAQQGWGAWTMYSNGTWREHRERALEAVKQVRLADGVGTDDSVGAAIAETSESLTNPLGMFRALFDVIGDPRRLGYLVLGAAVAIVAVAIIVREAAAPAGQLASVIPHPAAQAAAAVTGD